MSKRYDIASLLDLGYSVEETSEMGYSLALTQRIADDLGTALFMVPSCQMVTTSPDLARAINHFHLSGTYPEDIGPETRQAAHAQYRRWHKGSHSSSDSDPSLTEEPSMPEGQSGAPFTGARVVPPSPAGPMEQAASQWIAATIGLMTQWVQGEAAKADAEGGRGPVAEEPNEPKQRWQLNAGQLVVDYQLGRSDSLNLDAHVSISVLDVVPAAAPSAEA